jgi:ribosomal protein S12 methylthiotransferase
VVPDVAIRTTCIVGFPGETESDFQILMELLEEIRFDGVGCFTYSPQEGTHAWGMEDDVPDEIKRDRQEQVNELQRALSAEKCISLIGTEVNALVDSREGEGSEARAWWQAHEIDGVLYLDRALAAGTLVRARITALENDYDMKATVVEILSPVTAPPGNAKKSRQLPLAMASTGAYGR